MLIKTHLGKDSKQETKKDKFIGNETISITSMSHVQKVHPHVPF